MSYTHGQMNLSQLLFLDSNEKLYHLKSCSTTVLPQFKLNLNLSKNNDLNNRKSDRQIVTSYNIKPAISFTKSIKGDVPSLKLSVMNVPLILNSNASLTVDKTNTDNIVVKNYNSFYYQWSCTKLLKRILIFCEFITKNVLLTSIKKNYKKFSTLFGTIYAANLRREDELVNLKSIIKSENEYCLSIFEKKITNVMQELSQIRMKNEETLFVLKKEIATLKESNEALTKELKNVSNTLESIEINSKVIVSKPEKSILIPACSTPQLQPPPPPPPPPPLPPLSPSFFSLSITPKSTKDEKNGYRPTKKLLITEKQPPIITVEDLRKVKLKKAPEKNNKENEKNIGIKSHGPIISLDMLKKVKLKSIKCKMGNNQNVRQPLRTLKDNRSELTLEF